MPYILNARDYYKLIPKQWRVAFRHPSASETNLFVQCGRMKVKFTCSCGNTWSTMEGYLRIFIWSDENEVNHICLMLYQEECANQGCGKTPSKDNINWYHKEFKTLLKKVIYKYQNPTTKNNPIDVVSAQGKPKGPHKENHCEACRKKFH